MAGTSPRLTARTFATVAKSLGRRDPSKFLPLPKKEADHGNPNTWRNIFFLFCLPTLTLLSYKLLSNQPEHPPRPPFVAYSYLRIRNKRYPWGDGNRTLFHNPHVNCLPEGYEDELEH